MTPSPSPNPPPPPRPPRSAPTPIVPLAAGANLANYTVVYVNGTLTVGKAVLTVTANNQNIPPLRGRAPPPTPPPSAASSTGTPRPRPLPTTSSPTTPPPRSTPEPTRSTLRSATARLANYSFTFVPGTLTITQATPTVTAGNASRAYGAANPTFSASATGALPGDTFTFTESTTATTSSPIGTYAIVPLAAGANLANYTVVYVNGTLTVGKAVLTVTANNQNIAYGAALPTYTTTLTGFLNGDTQATAVTGSPSLTTSPATPVNAGTYPINAAIGTLASANYSFSFVPGTLTIGQATLTVTAANASRAYGAANPTFSASATGALPGDTFTFTESTTATTSSPVGTYAIVPLAAGASLANYTVVYVNGTLTVGKAVLTVTANNQNIAYGAALPTYTTTLTGFLNGDTQATAVTGSAALSTTPATPVNAGTYPINAAIGTLASANYSFSFVPGTLTIGQATLTVTAANASRAYGAANPTFSASATGALPGDTFTFTESTTATTSSPVGTYAIVPLAAGASLANYTVVYVNGTLTVGKAVLTVTANNQNIAYGAALPTYTTTLTGFLNGDTQATAVTGSPSLTTTPATPVNAGTYPINAAIGSLASANYSFSFVPGTLTIGQATLTVTAANASRAYGAANPTFSASATGALPGDTFTFTESTTATVSSPVGTYAIVPLAAGASLANYTVVYVNGTLTVGKAVLTITANNQNIAYGAALPTYTTTLTGFLNGDTQATAVTGSPSLTTTPATPVNAGTYPINAAIGTLASANYSFSFVPGTLTIGQATLTVTAANASRAYGAANPTFSASATGALPGDTFTFTESTTATVSSPVGTYAIVPLAAGASLANYTVVYVNGTLTVGKAVLTVTANNQNIAYGAALPTYTTTLTGFLNGDTQATAVTGSPSLTTTPATPVNAGTYPINAALGTLASSNYSFSFVPGTLTIGQATLTVTAANASRAYGAANPTFSASATGALPGDTFTFTESTTATTSSPVGTYAIVPLAAGASLANYTVVYVNGTLTVGKAVLTVTANNQNIAYGAALPTYTTTLTGFLNGDTQATAVTGSAALSTTPATPVNAGTYTITAALGTLAAANYSFTFVNGTLTIGQATLTVTAANASRTYGAANPTFSASAAGAVNGDTFTFTESTTATTSSPVGTYADRPPRHRRQSCQLHRRLRQRNPHCR